MGVPLSALAELPGGRAPARPLALARIAVGAASLLEAFDTGQILPLLAQPATLHAPWLADLPRPGATAISALLVLWWISATATLLGARARIACPLLAGVLATVLALDQQLYSHHLYLLTLLALLLGIADSSAALSVDALLRGGRPRVAAWPVLLMELQLSVVYGFAALAKIGPLFLSGDVLREEMPNAPALLTGAGAAVATILLELFLAVGFWLRRLRPAAAALGLLLHLGMVLWMSPRLPLVVFALAMLGLYGLFFRRPSAVD